MICARTPTQAAETDLRLRSVPWPAAQYAVSTYDLHYIMMCAVGDVGDGKIKGFLEKDGDMFDNQWL
jgi:hypothetical protein